MKSLRRAISVAQFLTLKQAGANKQQEQELIGQRSLFMQILEIVTSLGKT